MVIRQKRVLVLLAILVLVLPLGAAAQSYVADLKVSVEKSLYGPSEEMHISGSLHISNLSSNDTSFQPANATINVSLANASSAVSQHFLNTSASGAFRSRSDVFQSEIQVRAPSASGYYNLTASYTDLANATWKAGAVIRVFSEAIDIISIAPSKAHYQPGENVSINLKALRELGDSKVALANVTINGSMRYNNRTVITQFYCTTGGDGSCATSVAAPGAKGTYILEANNFLSMSSFKVVPFETFAYIKDSTGKSFKEVFSTNEVATVEVRVTVNGTTPTGEFVFNGTITDINNNVIDNITSTTLDGNNSHTNRFSFTITNKYTSGEYFAHITAYQTQGGSSSASATAFFQVRSWTLIVEKATKDNGFEYEYTTFPGRNISLEIFPKERQNGTIIPGINSSQFNITLKSKTGEAISSTNTSWNSTCGGSGCYAFSMVTPSAAGSYTLTVSLNYSNEVQTVRRIIGLTTTTLSSIPTDSEGNLKELFGTTEPVYVSLTAKNGTATVNVTNVVLESVIYENGSKFTFSEVASWGDVNGSNPALEWAFNATAQRIKLDAPKSGGNYLITMFANNRSAATSTKFAINPYMVCSSGKTTAGSVATGSYYVWQYKTTDTVYIELKITQAQNPLGRAAASNSSRFNHNSYGMGFGCVIDTATTQVITNATIQVEKAVNLQTGATTPLNTTATYCSADDNQGTYSCTIKPLTRWDGGRYSAQFKITGSDGQTTDKAESVFEARAFYLWAYSNSWTNKPDSNITFTVDMYEAGSNWWSNYGSGGISGEVTVEKIEYNGKDGEWLWPPINLNYNTSGLNSSTITNGRGSINLTTARLPKGRWEPGYYVLTIKGTNTATGESDYGQAWFGIKRWDSYSIPVEKSGTNFRYKNSFGTKENISLYIRITNAGDWGDNGGTALGANITIGVKKLQYYTTWPPTDLNTSSYAVQKVKVDTSSPWYYTANANTYNNYVLNISPTNGRWDGGYYTVILDVNGSETGYGWFNALAFYINTQPTDAGGTYLYSNKGTGPVYFNISTMKNQKSYFDYYSSGDYVNTTVKDMTLRTWLEGTWESREFHYPEDLNISPSMVNGTAIVQVNKSGNWPSGYYSGEVIMEDAENSTSTGYVWFSVRPFRVETTITSYTIDTDSNISVTLKIREPDWSNNALITGNYTITDAYEDSWSGTGSTRTRYTNYAPSANQTFNGSTILNVSPSTTWTSNNNGYHYLTVAVRDNSDNSTQQGWISFRSVPFSVSIGSIPNSNSITQTGNVTVPVTVTKAVSGANATANISRAYEWTWPTQTTYELAVGSCRASSTCQVNGTQNVTIIPPSGGWGDGWHYIYLEFMSADGSNKLQADNSAWFRSVQAYDGYFSNYNSDYTQWKYNFGFTENLTITLYVRNSNYVPQDVNITKVEISEDGDSCWSEGCKTYRSYSYDINESSNNEISGNGTLIIINNGTWKRGQHSIKATVSGNAGTAVIKTGYVWVKDTAAPTVTISSPQNGEVINSSPFTLRITSSENIRCTSIWIQNYNDFSTYRCQNSTTSAACNSTRFNGSTSVIQYIANDGLLVDTHTYSVDASWWTDQDYGISAWCEDVDYNSVNALASFTLNLTQANAPVRVNLSLPVNNSVHNSTQNITFVYNASGPTTPGQAVVTCELYTNVSGNWSVNATTGATLSSTVQIVQNASIGLFNNGTYKWNVRCYQNINSTNTGWGAANLTFNVTTPQTLQTSAAVSINLSSPANSSITNTSTVTFSYNASGSSDMTCSLYTNSNLSNAWQIRATNTSATPGRQSATSAFTMDGSYLWNALCTDDTNSSNFAYAAANFTLIVQNTTTITVNLSSPANLSTVSTAPEFIYNATGARLLNCSVWGNFTGSWLANVTNSSVKAGQVAGISIDVSAGNYTWNARCVNAIDSAKYAWQSLNWTFTRS